MSTVTGKIETLPQEPQDRAEDEAAGSPQELDAEHLSEEELPQLADTEVLVGSLRDGRLRVSTPFLVKYMVEEPQVIAEAPEFNEFGFGGNQSEALADLQRAITELYFTLEEEQERLGADLQRVWASLQQVIQKIQNR